MKTQCRREGGGRLFVGTEKKVGMKYQSKTGSGRVRLAFPCTEKDSCRWCEVPGAVHCRAFRPFKNP